MQHVDDAWKALMHYIETSIPDPANNMCNVIRETYRHLALYLFPCDIVVDDHTPAAPDLHVLLPMCGVLWTPTRNPTLSYKWVLQSHPSLAINATFLMFQLPAIKVGCSHLGVGVGKGGRWGSVKFKSNKFCGFKHPWSEYAGSHQVLNVEFYSSYIIDAPYGFIL